MSASTSDLLHGVLPVLHTPFTDHGEIDRSVLQREIDWAFDVGANGVVVAMVSEILRLGYRRRRELAELVCEAAQGRGFCVVNVGAESIAEAVEFAGRAVAEGAGQDLLQVSSDERDASGNVKLKDIGLFLREKIDCPG